MMVTPCVRCDDTGWVCEAHPDRPWSGPRACECGGAALPCDVCNPDEPLDMSRLFRVTRHDQDPRH
jgi:hypothetical protein